MNDIDLRSPRIRVRIRPQILQHDSRWHYQHHGCRKVTDITGRKIELSRHLLLHFNLENLLHRCSKHNVARRINQHVDHRIHQVTQHPAPSGARRHGSDIRCIAGGCRLQCRWVGCSWRRQLHAANAEGHNSRYQSLSIRLLIQSAGTSPLMQSNRRNSLILHCLSELTSYSLRSVALRARPT